MIITTNSGHTHECPNIGLIRLKELPAGRWRVILEPRAGDLLHPHGSMRTEIDDVPAGEIRRMYKVAPHLFRGVLPSSLGEE